MYLVLNDINSISNDNNSTLSSMWQCSVCKIKVISHNGYVPSNHHWDNAKVCFTCHWFHNDVAIQDRGASFSCSDCTTVPCEVHALAVATSFARSALLQFRHEQSISSNTPVSQQEHDFATAIRQTKLQEFKASRNYYSRTIVDKNQDTIMMAVEEPMQFPPIRRHDHHAPLGGSVNKRRSATVTPCPEEARGRCCACHVPIQVQETYCASCYLESPDGRFAKRAKTITSSTEDAEMSTD
jgi:hypothetical protein